MSQVPNALRPLLSSNEGVVRPTTNTRHTRTVKTVSNVTALVFWTLFTMLLTAYLLAFGAAYDTKFSNEDCAVAKFRCDLNVCLTEVKNKCADVNCLIKKCMSDEECLNAVKHCNPVTENFLIYKWEKSNYLSHNEKVYRTLTFGTMYNNPKVKNYQDHPTSDNTLSTYFFTVFVDVLVIICLYG